MKIFDAKFEKIKDDAAPKNGQSNPELREVFDWLRESIDYNAFHGKKTRGVMVALTVDFLRNGEPLDGEMDKALILGWCVELLQALFLIADDIMDNSKTRRGKDCWYIKNGLMVINDTFLIEHCIYQLLRKYFGSLPCYMDIIHLFHDITYATAIGQQLDLLASDPQKKLDLDLYTMEKYKAIVKYKTAYYSFYLPVALGMALVGIKDEESYERAKNVLMSLGEYFQAQDDFLDVYGDPIVIGKIGTDIEDAKCSWLVVRCLEKCSEKDRARLSEIYGKADKEKIKEVKEVFSKYQIQAEFDTYEEESKESIKKMVLDADPEMSDPLSNLLLSLVGVFYKRKK